MIYHALRLACITFSSIKTWSAVVDSTDRSKARRHMFLWFLILAGLSVEPIADTLFSSRIPMYEGIKIMFAGWLLLAHFDISRPENQPPRQNNTIPEDSHRSSQRAQLETQHNHLHHPTSSRQSSYLSTAERIPATPGGGLKADGDSGSNSTMLRATNLDFGRFKRDLERRRSHSRTHSHITEDTVPARTNSRLGHIEPSPSAATFPSKGDIKYTPTSASVLRAGSLQQGHESTTSTTITTVQQVTPGQDAGVTHSGKRSPLGTFLFGGGKFSLKRPSSAMSEDRPSPSLTRNTSNLSSRSQPRPSALHRTPSGQRSGGEHRVRINAESPGGKNKRQRHSPEDRDKFAEPEEDEQPQARQSKNSQKDNKAKAESKSTGAPISASIPTPAPNATTSSAKFARPKPPRKSRSELQPEVAEAAAASKDLSPQHQRVPESTSRDLFSPSATETAEGSQVISASFESRMKNVRAWIKGRNPSMISPTLTATSEATATHLQLKRRSSSFLQQDEKPKSSGKGGLDDLPKITKRKAARQLAPAANTKRWAAEGDLERPSQWTVADDDRLQRQNIDNSRRRSGEGTEREASRLYPDLTADLAGSSTARQRAQDYSFSQPMPATRWSSATRIAGERSRPSSLPTNVDWERFQRLIGTAPKRTSSSSTLMTSTAPSSALHRKSTIATLINHQDDNLTVAPLIKLRQSQLRQHQEEDFFGMKRKDGSGGNGDGIRNKFDSTLDLWEQEDDESLARNAAREAEEVEARSQLRLSQGRRDSSSSSSLLAGSPPEDERALFTFSSPSRISKTTILATDPGYEMAAPTPSLLRTIPFNGESSRRPVPDFQPKKSSNTTTALLQEAIKPLPARRTSQSGQDNTNPFLEKGTSSSGGGGRSAPSPPRFNFNFAGAASLAKKRAQTHQFQSQQGTKTSPEEVAARRERHPGLYTPSKKKAASAGTTGVAANSSEQQGSAFWKESQLSRPSSSPFKHPSTPTVMSRYIELSSLSDDYE